MLKTFPMKDELYNADADRVLHKALVELLREELDPLKVVELSRALDEVMLREERRKVRLRLEQKRKSAA